MYITDKGCILIVDLSHNFKECLQIEKHILRSYSILITAIIFRRAGSLTIGTIAAEIT